MIKRTRSFCPTCKHDLAWYDNIPIISYIILMGKCRYCKIRIHPRYLVVEVLTAGLFLFVFHHEVNVNGAAMTSWGGPFYPAAKTAVHLLLIASLVAVAFIDCLTSRIPNEITIPGIIAAPVLSALIPSLHESAFMGSRLFEITGVLRMDAFLSSLAGIFIGGGVLWVLGIVGEAILKKPAMGFGDVKLMAMVGGLTGFPAALLGITLGAFLGSIVGLVSLMITGRRRIVFGPFLAIGTFIAMFWGPELIYLYLSWIFLDADVPRFRAVFFPLH